MHYKSLQCDKETIRYLHLGKGRPLLFLHGFGFRPHVYADFLEGLGQKFEVFAPSIFGINDFVTPLITIEDLLRLTNEFVSHLSLEKPLVVGYSLGGGISLRYASDNNLECVALCPLSPVNYKTTGFIARSMLMYMKQLFCVAGDDFQLSLAAHRHTRKNLGSYMANILRNPLSTLRLVNSISTYNFPDLSLKKTMLVYCSNDEFFPLKTEDRKKLGARAGKISVLKGNHENLLYNPEPFIKVVTDFFI